MLYSIPGFSVDICLPSYREFGFHVSFGGIAVPWVKLAVTELYIHISDSGAIYLLNDKYGTGASLSNNSLRVSNSVSPDVILSRDESELLLFALRKHVPMRFTCSLNYKLPCDGRVCITGFVS